MAKRICSADGCTRVVRARGWCNEHYARWRRTGDARPDVPVGQVKWRFCSVENCDEVVRAYGLCGRHAWRKKNWGDVGVNVPLGRSYPPLVCSVVGCSESVRNYRRRLCESHYYRFQRYGAPTAVNPKVPVPGAETRVCRKCAADKPIGEFSLRADGVDGRDRLCKTCTNAERHGRRQANRERAILIERRSRVRVKYGELGVQLYERIRAGASCEACGQRAPQMTIDHDHATGRARGILCHHCNAALGLLKEDPSRFDALLGYLKRSC